MTGVVSFPRRRESSNPNGNNACYVKNLDFPLLGPRRRGDDTADRSRLLALGIISSADTQGQSCALFHRFADTAGACRPLGMAQTMAFARTQARL